MWSLATWDSHDHTGYKAGSAAGFLHKPISVSRAEHRGVSERAGQPATALSRSCFCLVPGFARSFARCVPCFVFRCKARRRSNCGGTFPRSDVQRLVRNGPPAAGGTVVPSRSNRDMAGPCGTRRWRGGLLGRRPSGRTDPETGLLPARMRERPVCPAPHAGSAQR
jgi:hypothetical protein